MKYKLNKILSLLIPFVLILSLCIPHSLAESTSFINEIYEKEVAFENDEKIQSSFSVNDDFVDDTVLVVLKMDYSKINYQYSIEDFNGIAYESIEEITEATTTQINSLI